MPPEEDVPVPPAKECFSFFGGTPKARDARKGTKAKRPKGKQAAIQPYPTVREEAGGILPAHCLFQEVRKGNHHVHQTSR